MKRQLIMSLVMLGLASHAMATMSTSPNAKEVAARYGITEQKAKRVLSEVDSLIDGMSPAKALACKKLVDALNVERDKVADFIAQKDVASVRTHFTQLKRYREAVRQKHCLPTSLLDLAQDKVNALDEKLRTH